MMIYRDFLEAGYPIIGLHPIIPGDGCGCGDPHCKNAGKHPYSSAWQSAPLWSDEQIDCMIEMGQLSTGYGVVMRGLLVIDVDARNGGVESLARLLDAIPTIAGAGMIVETGSGGGSKHFYFSLPADAALSTHLAEYPGVDFKSSGYVVGPGSLHASGGQYALLVGSPGDIMPAPPELIERLRKRERIRAEISGKHIDISIGDVADMLRYIDPDDYDRWVRVGMAIHDVTCGAGLDLWDTWSQGSDKYRVGVCDNKWHSFGKSQTIVSFGTLAHYAQEGGWQFPVEFESPESFDFCDTARHDGLPIDISGVDLLRPPGFVGELAAWISSQSRRPREYLAVAAALQSVGNIIGLNYVDGSDGVTSNLFTFCVAGSATGKESIQQAAAQIHQIAGLAPACHGTIKSEQEIMRNLAIRHQAAFYVIDEIGTLFQKIKSATERGGASYLEGVVGVLMSAYSKADGVMMIGGDLREEIRQLLNREIAAQRKARDERDERFDQTALDRLLQQIKSIDNGLTRPFLSLCGFTTPETFYSCVDKSNATNGFFGRSLLFIEHETVPRFRVDHQAPAMPDALCNALILLAADGRADARQTGQRIEQTHDRIPIPSTPEATAAMRDIRAWLDDKADAEKGASGLEALYLRCYELVAKVAFILAAPGGVRELVHVAFAFALVLRDVRYKSNIVLSNDDKNQPEASLMARIVSLIGDDGETQGVIVHRINRRKRNDICATLDKMVERGILRSVEEKKTTPTIRYFLV